MDGASLRRPAPAQTRSTAPPAPRGPVGPGGGLLRGPRGPNFKWTEEERSWRARGAGPVASSARVKGGSPPRRRRLGARRGSARLGALDSRVDVAGLTPASFVHAKLEPDAKFGTPVSIQCLDA